MVAAGAGRIAPHRPANAGFLSFIRRLVKTGAAVRSVGAGKRRLSIWTL
ncbi:MAG: hypothetical protein ACLSGI_09595 [Butyricicoccaceae bacterium]